MAKFDRRAGAGRSRDRDDGADAAFDRGIALTLSAYFASVVGLDQGCALIIGQNIGTAASSAMAAIGASATAKRLAIAYVLFKLIAALIALTLFPVVTPLLVRASRTVDGVTLLAAYHTAYNVLGVAVLMPVIDRFTRFDGFCPSAAPLTRCLDPSALELPIAAVEAVRRTIARALGAVCGSVEATFAAAGRGGTVRSEKEAVTVSEAGDALRQAQIFMSEVNGPPESEDEQRRVTSTLHAPDHASRLAEAAREGGEFGATCTQVIDARAMQLCAEAIQRAAAVVRDVATLPDGHPHGAPPAPKREAPVAHDAGSDVTAISGAQALAQLEYCAKALGDLRRAHRSDTLGEVANGTLTAGDALAGVDAVRILEALAHHAWRSAGHLVGRAEERRPARRKPVKAGVLTPRPPPQSPLSAGSPTSG